MATIAVRPTDQELRQAFAAVRGLSFPAIPQVLTELQRVLWSNDPDTRKAVSLISQDQAIAGLVLKTVNSATFALREQVSSIAHAVALLGLEPLANLVTGAVSQKYLPAQGALAREIRDDSLEVARGAMRIARQVEGITPDEAYLTGLLHDCGAMILADRLAAYDGVWRVKCQFPFRFLELEERRVRTSHPVVGYLFCKHWKLPERVCSAVYLHHTPACERIDDRATRALVATIQLAEAFIDGKNAGTESLSMEYIQFLMHAKKELLLDDATMDELKREAAMGFE